MLEVRQCLVLCGFRTASEHLAPRGTIKCTFALLAVLDDPWVRLNLLKRDSLLRVEDQQLVHVSIVSIQ